jgi:hypothetical protein
MQGWLFNHKRTSFLTRKRLAGNNQTDCSVVAQHFQNANNKIKIHMNTQPKTSSSTLTPPHANLIQELVNCALACEACASACLAEEDVTMMTRCIELDRDCSDVCSLAARLVLRESEVASHYLKAVEEICELCAEECNKHEHAHCKACAEACQSCAEACRSNFNKMV